MEEITTTSVPFSCTLVTWFEGKEKNNCVNTLERRAKKFYHYADVPKSLSYGLKWQACILKQLSFEEQTCNAKRNLKIIRGKRVKKLIKTNGSMASGASGRPGASQAHWNFICP